MTKYGVTLKTLRAYRGKPNLHAGDVKALTLNGAEAIYRTSYWTQAGGDPPAR
ncbi:glycosyl hydrolase 108 family protein [Mesorhizobium shangrilense]|uniref:Glycosyl hydrolase 108 family protein n=1 Tax=Mesorhizobium shangrilense TaxID=460060 RepID=A0ABV2D764_9HYPH